MTRADRWQLTIASDAAAMSELAADAVAEVIRATPEAVITVPTGSTPLHLFDILVARAHRQEIDFGRVHLFSLDDYLGLSIDDPNSLSGWLSRAFLRRIAFAPDRVHLIPANADDPQSAALEYDRALARQGGFDIAVVGMGENGHVAFNEPGSDASSRTRVVDLTPETVAQASAYWGNRYPIPARAMTVGIANLLEARRIVLIVSGAAKAGALQRALEGPTEPSTPASLLRLAGPRFEVIADRDAASLLSVVDAR